MLIQEKNLQNSAFYFVHSFFVKCKNKEIEIGTSLNGKLNFSSIVKKNNVIAFQFHPEKSGHTGLILLKNLVKNFNKFNVEKQTFIGWNRVKFKEKQILIQEKSIEKELLKSAFYFVHSFFVNCENKEIEAGTSFNGELNFPSIVKKDKVVAFQFHPEKSGNNGLILLKNTVRNIL